MNQPAASIRLCPAPFFVFRFADAAVELRYRLVLNYAKADRLAKTGEPPVPPVVRRVFNKFVDVTNLINADRLEDKKFEGHIIAARKVVERFEREWLSDDHRTRLAKWNDAREAFNELTEYDWASIRRNPDFDTCLPSLSEVEAETLHGSPFSDDAWVEYEAAVERFVETFDQPCRTLYRLVCVLAAVCYPNPATYNTTLGTLPVLDDEHLITLVIPQVRQLIVEFQSQTCFNLNVGDWFEITEPYSSATQFFETIGKILRGWRGEVTVAPVLDRPRWQPAEPGANNLGVLSFRGTSAPVARQGKVIATVLQAFEDGSWEQPVPFPDGKVPRGVLQSLKNWAMNNELSMTFASEKQGNHFVCRWHPSEET